VIEISAIIILVIIIGIIAWRYYVNATWYKKATDGSLYLTSVGAPSAPANADTSILYPGQDVVMKCPVGTNISLVNVSVNGAPTPAGQNSCWSALSQSSPGYPLSGNPDSTYTSALKALQASYNGKNSATINMTSAPDQNMADLIGGYFIQWPSLSEDCTLGGADASGGTYAWAPMITCLYECTGSS